MAGWTFRPVVKWQPGAAPTAAFLQPGKAAGHQWSRAGQAGEGQGTPTNLPPKGGCSPGGRGGRPPLGTCPQQGSSLPGRPENFDGGQKPEGN